MSVLSEPSPASGSPLPGPTPPSAAVARSRPAPSGPVSGRSDFFGGMAWIGLGIVILLASIAMDRLEAQGVHPYTVPGLMPGILGIAMIFLGLLLALRGLRRGVGRHPSAGGTAPEGRRQILRALVLCIGFAAGLVGHGLPFWLAATVFIAVAIPVLQTPARRSAGRRLTLRDVALPVLIGAGAGGLISVVFQTVFLVRLP